MLVNIFVGCVTNCFGWFLCLTSVPVCNVIAEIIDSTILRQFLGCLALVSLLFCSLRWLDARGFLMLSMLGYGAGLTCTRTSYVMPSSASMRLI